MQLKGALNVVWGVEETKQGGLWHLTHNYVLSFAAVLALGFLLQIVLMGAEVIHAYSKQTGALKK